MLHHRSRPPLARIMTIDRQLRAQTWPNTRTLADEIGGTPHDPATYYDYLRYQLNAPIEFDGVRNGYYYTQATFRMSFPQLSQGEMLALYLSAGMMR